MGSSILEIRKAWGVQNMEAVPGWVWIFSPVHLDSFVSFTYFALRFHNVYNNGPLTHIMALSLA